MINDKKFALFVIPVVVFGVLLYMLLLAKPFSELDDCLSSDLERAEELKLVAALIDQGDETQEYYCELSHRGYLQLEECLDEVKMASKLAYSIYTQLPRFTSYKSIVERHNLSCTNPDVDLAS